MPGRGLRAAGEGRSARPAQVHHDAHVQGVHVLHEAVQLLLRHADVLMVVHVDERILRPRDLVLGDDERGLRLVVLDGHRLGVREPDREERGKGSRARPHERSPSAAMSASTTRSSFIPRLPFTRTVSPG